MSQPCTSWEHIKLALTLLFFMPGAPCIYYGEELGMHGGKDPDNRRSIPWDKLPEMQEEPVYALVKELTRMRQDNPILRDGKMEITCDGDGFTVVRTLGKKKMTLAVSLADKLQTFEIK